MNSFEEALEGEMNMEESDYETCNICDFNNDKAVAAEGKLMH